MKRVFQDHSQSYSAALVAGEKAMSSGVEKGA